MKTVTPFRETQTCDVISKKKDATLRLKVNNCLWFLPKTTVDDVLLPSRSHFLYHSVTSSGKCSGFDRSRVHSSYGGEAGEPLRARWVWPCRNTDVSGAHTLCLFGFCPASNINLQTHYRSYCMQAICLRAGHGLKCFEMSQFTIHEFQYQNNPFFDTFIFRIHVFLKKCTSKKRRQTSVAKETLAAFALREQQLLWSQVAITR